MKDQNIVNKFESAVSNYPDNVALKTENSIVTYKDLNDKVNSLARLIRKSVVGESNNVTLLLDHNEEIVIAILAVLKTCKSYIPIDPHFPLERAKKILNNSGSSILLTTNSQLSLAYKLLNASENETSIINISDVNEKITENPGLVIEHTAPAYVIYTSGSSGEPKGVVQSHFTIVNSISNYIKELDINANDNILLTTPYSHTVSVIDIFSALFAGACLTIFNIKKSFDIENFCQRLAKFDVSIIHTVPTFFRYFIKSVTDKSYLDKIRLIILGGEEVIDKDVEFYKDNFNDDCLFINLYGSSEVVLGCFNVINKKYDNNLKTIPIGFPFDNVKALIMDDNMQQTPVHGIGELYFEADFLSPKYYKDEKGTQGLIVSKPGEKDKEMVRMGDLVKQLPDGNIQLMGRKDNQIKISGNRVHLNEIESCLDADAIISQSVVTVLKNESNDLTLLAFITTQESNPDIESLKDRLRTNLPAYMIPAFYVKLEKIPLTPNGKVDRNGLPKINFEDLAVNKEVHEKTALQKVVLGIWKESLEKDDITIYDNFFHLGGNSLIATEIVNKIFLELDTEVELSTIFDYQSVFELAKFLEAEKLKQVI